jgi:hypothetical protein
MIDSPKVSKPNVVLGVHLNATQADLVRRRAQAADRSVSAELRRQLHNSGYLERPAAQHTTIADR